jgi:DNA-binding Lrp family transcriptional regulator
MSAMNREALNLADKALLNVIQQDFPVCPRPYAELAQELGEDEQEILRRVIGLKAHGTIKRIGAVFDTQRLGFASTLVAMHVPEERIDEVAEEINSYSGVSHNYKRAHHYNLWFTFAAESREALASTIDEIRVRNGIDDILVLPARKVFKIRVNFEI